MYLWLLFLHVAAVLAFMLAHGVHMTIMWKWRWEADPERGLTLFNGVPEIHLTRILAATVVVTGLLLAVAGGWLARWWPWLSLATLLAIWAAMYRWGGGYFNLVQAAAERAIEERRSGSASTAAMDAYRATRLGWQPIGMTVFGLGGLAAILWLMIFKPF